MAEITKHEERVRSYNVLAAGGDAAVAAGASNFEV
jgi:hypothetical protein